MLLLFLLYTIRGIKPSLVAAKMLQKTEMRRSLSMDYRVR